MTRCAPRARFARRWPTRTNHGILHRDLKPANVWLGPDGSAKLGDFGLALLLDRPRVTTAGSILGTPEYMSPEQALGTALEPASDLYGLGAMLYEMLTGRPPFLAETPIAVVSQHLHSQALAPSWHRSELPPEIDRIVLSLLAKAVEDRPSSASEVGAALHALEEQGFEAAGGPADATRNPLDRLARGLFVGRSEEMARLRASVEQAVAGRASLVLLAGDPGIGKTRTAQELCTYAGLRGASTAFGRCHEGGAAPSFWPFAQILRGIVDDGGDEVRRLAGGDAAASLAKLLDGPAEEEAPSTDGEGGAAQRFLFFDAVRRFLTAVAQHRPLVLVIDDLHWADGSSLAMIQFLVRELDLARIAIVVIYRPADLEPPWRRGALSLRVAPRTARSSGGPARTRGGRRARARRVERRARASRGGARPHRSRYRGQPVLRRGNVAQPRGGPRDRRRRRRSGDRGGGAPRGSP